MKLLGMILKPFSLFNFKSNKALLSLGVLSGFVSLLMMSVCSAFSVSELPNWQPVPLRTQAQKNAGLAGGEGLQQVMSIVFAPSAPSRVYLSSDTSQVWRSDNGGLSWRKSNAGFFANGARSLFVHPLNEDIVFAAGFLGKEKDRIKSGGKPAQGVFLSTDGAVSWRQVHSTAFYKQEGRGGLFALDKRTISRRNFTLYLGTYDDGLLESIDGGRTWRETTCRIKEINCIAESVFKPGKIFLASTSGLYSFFNGHIEKLGNGLPTWPRSISVVQSASSTIYAVVGKDGVYKSVDDGATFIFSGRGLSPFVNWSDIASAPTDANVLYVKGHESSTSPFYSHDGGRSWHKALSTNIGGLVPLEGMYFSSPIVVHPYNPNVALLSSNGKATVLRTENGGKTWQYSGNGYMGGRLRGMAFASSKKFYLALTDHGVWGTDNGGQIFAALSSRSGKKSVQAVAVSGEKIFIGIGGWGEKSLEVSHDAGATWVQFEDLKGLFDVIHVHSRRENIIYAGKYRSVDSGRTWTSMNYEVRAVYLADNNILYAIDGTSDVRLMVSKDMGQTWSSPFPSIPIPVKSVHAISVHPTNVNSVILATSNGVFILDKNVWKLRDHRHGLALDHFGRNYVETVIHDDDNPNILYAGRRSPGDGVSNGLFRSSDKGESWHSWNGNLGDFLAIWSIHCSPFDNTVYIGTSHGTYATKSSN